MHTTRRSPAFLGLSTALLLALLLAACGGGPGATTGPGGPTATTPGSAGSSASAAPGATMLPGVTAATGQPGGGPSGSRAPGVTDEACTMLMAADVEAILGASLVTAVPAQQLGIFTNGCLFELSVGGTTTSVNLGVMTSGGRAYYDAEIKPTNTQNGYTSIVGLGDEAVNARPGSVLVVAGDVLLSVNYFGPTGPDQALAAEVARRVLENLGL